MNQRGGKCTGMPQWFCLLTWLKRSSASPAEMEKKKGQSSAGEERVTGRVTRGHVKCNYAAALSHVILNWRVEHDSFEARILFCVVSAPPPSVCAVLGVIMRVTQTLGKESESSETPKVSVSGEILLLFWPFFQFQGNIRNCFFFKPPTKREFSSVFLSFTPGCFLPAPPLLPTAVCAACSVCFCVCSSSVFHLHGCEDYKLYLQVV